ncbi:MAG: DinB family protein [Candidatus Tectomicrobia bacterium]|nr:DinB family protein [Candidatus Tectomicrobia bacterium]
MSETLRKILADALRGEGAHVDPVRAVSNLRAESATLQPASGVHSAYQLLSHMVYWQDLILQAARGEQVSWPASLAEGWKDHSAAEAAANWASLVARFQAGVEEAGQLARTADLDQPLANWGDSTVLKALSVLAVHNSYHLGQVVMARQVAGQWPPPDGGDT